MSCSYASIIMKSADGNPSTVVVRGEDIFLRLKLDSQGLG